MGALPGGDKARPYVEQASRNIDNSFFMFGDKRLNLSGRFVMNPA